MLFLGSVGCQLMGVGQQANFSSKLLAAETRPNQASVYITPMICNFRKKR